MASRQEVNLRGYSYSMKLIDDEIWRCHDYGITVYSLDMKGLRNIKLHSGKESVNSAASLDINAVVIATDDGLSTCSKQGL